MAKKKLSFYRPHKRVTFDNEYVDPVTGEVAKMPSMTKQEFKHECDINNVIKHFKPHHMQQMLAANLTSGMYTDLPDDYDFQSALELVKDAEKRFMTMPSKVRDRFGQDPAQFLAFASNPDNLSEMRELGLALPEPTPPPPVVVTMAPTEPNGGAGGSPPAGGAKAP